MSYYRPTFSQTAAMTRGRGYSSSRGSGYRGSSRGGSWGNSSRGGYSPSRGSGGGGRFSSSFNSFDSRTKYGNMDRYSSRGDDYRKSYRSEGPNYSRDHRGSPDRKRSRNDSLSSSRHDGYGGSGNTFNRYDSSGSGYGDRRSFSGDRRSFSRREPEFRKPAPPPPPSTPRGGYRGRVSARGPLRSRLRERPTRRRLIESSYAIRRRPAIKPQDFNRRLKIARLRSAVVRRSARKSKTSDNEESENEKEEEDEEKKVKVKEEKMDDEEAKDDDEDKKDEKDKESPKKAKSQEKDDKKDDSDAESPKKKYVKLVCPHCNIKCQTFGKYSMHLQSGRHIQSMRRVALKQKAIVSRMRLMQRNAQRELERNADDLASRTSFCPLCKLNYKQPKLTHQASEAHKNMKKFLMPYCKICKIAFKSPMPYESHCCSIDHIKRKSHADDKSDKEDGSGVDDNLENFMTIDSVGDMDEEEREKKKESDDSKQPKEQINVGIENVKKVEVYYCDLCRMYLPRGEESEMTKILAKHCKQRTHMQRYVRYKEDKDLAKRAERLQRKETAEREKEKVKEDPKNSDESSPNKEPAKENGETGLNEDENEEKIWADVDKDLGDILEEAQSGNKSSDEDEEEEDPGGNGERYDRFKLSEKNSDENMEEDIPKEATAADVKAEVVAEEK